jgi:AraC-like DNA-binding protein/mannose-6-phosphate isomerase-like protein (cupin superfamily)
MLPWSCLFVALFCINVDFLRFLWYFSFIKEMKGTDMSYDTDRYQLTKLSGQSLAVIECGIQICHSGHAAQRTMYRYYSAHFILEGKGIFRTGGASYELSAGQGFLITPGMICEYIADEEEPWKYVYATFKGADEDVLVHNAGLDDKNMIFSFPLEEDTVHDIYAMHSAGKKNEARGYDVTGYFLLCMSRLVRQNLASDKRIGSNEDYVKQACLYIKNHLSEIRSIEEVAMHVNIDRSYLYKLFRQYRSMSPSQYLMQCRLDRAAKLLENRELSISEIGFFVGFYDTPHFYRAFSAKFGTTPQKYREDRYGNN